MNRYMLAFTWNKAINPMKAGAEHEQVTKLIDEGKMEQMFLAGDRARGWLVMLADSPEAALESAQTLPFYPSMAIETTPLVQTYP